MLIKHSMTLMSVRNMLSGFGICICLRMPAVTALVMQLLVACFVGAAMEQLLLL